MSGYDIKTFAVATEFDKKEWKKFIKEQKIDLDKCIDINHGLEGKLLQAVTGEINMISN